MTRRRRTVRWLFSGLGFGLLVGLSGCQTTQDLSMLLQDFAREALAAFLL